MIDLTLDVFEQELTSGCSLTRDKLALHLDCEVSMLKCNDCCHHLRCKLYQYLW